MKPFRSIHAEPSTKENTMNANKLARLNNKNRRGQGMTEYIIIVALIAIAAIGVITTFGNDIRHIFDASTSALSGNTAATNSSVSYNTKSNNTMKNFGETNEGK